MVKPNVNARQNAINTIRRNGLKRKLNYVKSHYLLYLMLLLPIAYYIVFHYRPMYGIVIAFKNYSIFKGIADSAWCGLQNFKKLFAIKEFSRAIVNTIRLNVLCLVFSFPAPILLALMLNELKSRNFKKVTQTILYLPHFLSWVIIGGLVSTLFATNTGLINNALVSLGMNRIPWLSENKWWIVMYVLVSVWQSIGYGAIIYMSAMSSIDQEIYEAARVDGCSRFKMMYLITLPSIKTTIVIMLILKIGGMMSIGFEQPQMLKNAMVNDVGDVISTFIYRYGIQNAKHSLSTAAGLLQSVINFVLVMSANAVSRKISDESIW